MKTLTAIAVAVALGTTAAANAYEQPAYSVAETREGFEIRSYAPYLVVETVVEGEFDAARNAAFRKLFDYISGKNAVRERIAMTVPVTSNSAPRSEKIEMTVPVKTSSPASAGAHVMQFVVPSKYTLDSVPQPTDATVSVRRIEAQSLAVRTYSGRSSEVNYRENEAALLDALRAAGYTTTGAPMFAVYNGPFTPWFLRRNEVMVPVDPPKQASGG
jgi:hypothetical protein